MTILNKIMPRIDVAQCDGCGICIKRCPTGALAMENHRPRMARPDLCSYCATCEDVCPKGAIALPYQIVLVSNAPVQT